MDIFKKQKTTTEETSRTVITTREPIRPFVLNPGEEAILYWNVTVDALSMKTSPELVKADLKAKADRIVEEFLAAMILKDPDVRK